VKRTVEVNQDRPETPVSEEVSVYAAPTRQDLSVTLLTGGGDRPYVYGLTKALSSIGIRTDLIGSDELDDPDLRNFWGVNFFNLRGDQRHEAGFLAKILRVSAYYLKLMRYAATAKPKVFHILWNNKFEYFDRTLLMVYYKLLGKAVVFTAHNINRGRRDSSDSTLNRWTLRTQYRLTDHVFVHTDKMKTELVREFNVSPDRISVIPFGINNSVPDTSLSTKEAKERLGISEGSKAILFFGRIRPYKGLEYLIAAFQKLVEQDGNYRLIIAGRIEQGHEQYWQAIQSQIEQYVKKGQIISKIEFIPDSETEVYFKAADLFVLPYKEIFQSGVLVLGYSFGLPVIVADVGSLKEDVIEGRTGFVFKSEDTTDLARSISKYFASDLFQNLEEARGNIKARAARQYSWEVVGQITRDIYAQLSPSPKRLKAANSDSAKAPSQANTLQ
jgi:glycosyltransferase involved in cell wall biosynthesis